MLASDMVRALNQLRIDDKHIEEQNNAIDNLDKLYDTEKKHATENAEMVSICSRLHHRMIIVQFLFQRHNKKDGYRQQNVRQR